MLVQLAIRDIVLIEKLDLAFDSGLSVLTGETGAGKSILLDSLSLALGARGDGSLVRHGLAQGQVTAVFELPQGHAALRCAMEAGADVDGVLLLRRVQLADGRSRAYVNDQPVGVQALRTIGAALVEIHGQHDERALVSADRHRDLLDAFGGLEPLAAEVRSLSDVWRKAESAYEAKAEQIAAARREQEYLTHVADELTRLAPLPGEEDELATRRQVMMASEKVAAELAEAQEVIAGAHSPIPLISAMLRRLERRASQAPSLIDPAVKALDAALTALDEAQGALESSLRAAEYDPRELEQIEERLFALRAAARKHSTHVDDLPALADRFRADLAAIATGEADLAKLDRHRREAEKSYRVRAKALSDARRKAAAKLDAAVTAELPPLKLERARFMTEIASEDTATSANGFDRVEFHVQTNPGTRPGPLMKVASGGELARFMLALKVVLADRGSAPTLVFDEIDSGAGGAVADAIGQRLARLSARTQVLAVTHAPQVASKANRHLLIAKESVERGKRVATRVTMLDAVERREEIARMLSGEAISAEARAAADRLLAGG
ncbi:MAG TPA: DNA repair protein RecN, partial [Beijerinckiaceae bacterium]|nr:DNA repair protein RecN [Beijerinckiaceae bacterium]